MKARSEPALSLGSLDERELLDLESRYADLLMPALDRLPRDLFERTAPATGRSPASATLNVGTAAEGATIKEGSYLVHDGALVQILDGAPQPVTVREGKGTEGIPAKARQNYPRL